MEHSEDLTALATALVKVQAQLPTVDKDATAKVQSKTGASFAYTYATLPEVQRVLLPLLSAAGIAVVQGTGHEDEAGMCVETMLLHVSGQWVRSRVRIPMEKPSAQAAGSALAYGRRVGLVGALCLVTEEPDDDGATAEAYSPAARAEVKVFNDFTKIPPPVPPKPVQKPGVNGQIILAPGKQGGWQGYSGKDIREVPDDTLALMQSHYQDAVNNPAKERYLSENQQALRNLQQEHKRRNADVVPPWVTDGPDPDDSEMAY